VVPAVLVVVLLVVIVMVTVTAHYENARDVHIAPFPSMEEPYRSNSWTILDELRTTPLCALVCGVLSCRVVLYHQLPASDIMRLASYPRRRHGSMSTRYA
jgi:hypothetical protein